MKKDRRNNRKMRSLLINFSLILLFSVFLVGSEYIKIAFACMRDNN